MLHFTFCAPLRLSHQTQLFNATIRENIAYGAPEGYSEEDLLAAARAAQALPFIEGFEDGLATRVGERGQRLSGGQKQRISIARCLLRHPQLLLLDEATSVCERTSYDTPAMHDKRYAHLRMCVPGA